MGLSIKVQGEDSCVLVFLSPKSQGDYRRVESLGHGSLLKPPVPGVQMRRLGANSVPSLMSGLLVGRGKAGVWRGSGIES